MQPDRNHHHYSAHQNLEVIEDFCLETHTVTKYIKGNFLGKGGFARCYEVFPQLSSPKQQTLAVKIIQKCNLVKQRSKQKLMSQIKIHRSLDHQRVVKFLHEFQDHANVYILLELCPNKTLNDLIKRKRRLSESQVRYYMFQLLQGLEYLHHHRVIHRDLKLGNLFLDEDMQVKIGDFGLATKLQYSGEKRKTVCGTPNYIAPEILESKGHSCQVDIWSFGVIVYTLIYGRPPFQSKDVKETYKKIKSGIFTFPDTVQTSAAFKYLITSTLQKDPSRRPSVKDIKAFQFFRGGAQLSRQPSLCMKNHVSMSATKDDKQLSDNGKLYTNNELITSKDTARQKSQDRFLATDRNMSSTNKSFRLSVNNNVQRSGSQRVLRDSSNLKNSQKLENKVTPRLSAKTDKITEVRKWIDYSSKYGIGYVLSNGNFGVYFNDSTKILSSNQDNFFYIERVQREDVPIKYYFKDYPTELKKKVSLYNHFKGYLQNQTQNQFKFPNGSSNQKMDEKNLVYVRRWFRSKHAVIFRLSNKSVQVIFIDQSELLISATNRQVVYINKHKQRIQYLLADIMQSQNRQLIKRFQYTKEILSEMANNHNGDKKRL